MDDDLIFTEVEAPDHIEWHQGGRLPASGRVIQFGDTLGTPWWVHCPEPEIEPADSFSRLAYHRDLVGRMTELFLERYGQPRGIYFAALWHNAQPVLSVRFTANHIPYQSASKQPNPASTVALPGHPTGKTVGSDER